MSAAAVGTYPINYIECGFCHSQVTKGILKNKIRFCSVTCFTHYEIATMKRAPIVRICCICENIFIKKEFQTCTRGKICTRACFIDWLTEGMVKYNAAVMMQALFVPAVKK